MITPAHVEYVKKQLAAGADRGAITSVLLAHGWTPADIDAAFAGVAPLAPPPTAPAPPAGAAPPQPALAATPVPARKFHLLSLRGALGLCAAIIILSGGVYAYAEKLGPFARLPYSEDNLVSGLLAASARIKSSSYTMRGELTVSEREEDAQPFTLKNSNEAALKAQYERDAERAGDIGDILVELKERQGSYPSSLSSLIGARRSFVTSDTLADPAGGSYPYSLQGDGFALRATFETENALSTIRRSYGYDSSATTIEGKTVTFTEGSWAYLYLPKEPPKPFLEELGEMMRSLPAEISFAIGVAAATDWSKENADWKFNFDVTGDFGDLSFKVNADALKKEKTYYVRVNNIPSLFGAYFASMKGKWISFDPASASSSPSRYGNDFQELARELPELEEEYKENREKIVETVKTLARIADETHLLAFKSPPKSERIDGRLLYRYDLHMNKDAALPFYTKVGEAAEDDELLRGSELFNDPGTIEYLKSDEFSQTYEYLDANVKLTLWVDPHGYPAILAYTVRIVPPDTATQLKDKQINITWKSTFTDVNEPISIEAPKESTPADEIIEDLSRNLDLD